MQDDINQYTPVFLRLNIPADKPYPECLITNRPLVLLKTEMPSTP